jgi:RNA polymerase sigma factor (sigma-70 family)
MTDDDRTLLARFAVSADQAAFAELVGRHGPLVWGVCRRAVRSEPLAEEAFQAVFVVLSRKAGTLTLRTSLANWLFGVASRVAARAVRREARLKTRERIAVRRTALDRERQRETPGPEWGDMLRVLDEELAGIAEKYRGPLVACYLQGKTQDEAATDLGISIFKLRRRLAKARDLLRLRLTRRGVTLAGALFAGAVVANVGFAAPVPAATAGATVKAGLAAKLGGGVAAPVAALGAGAASSGVGAWVAGSVAVVVAAVVLVALLPSPPPAVEPVPREVAPPPRLSPSESPGEWATVRGQVVWPGPLPKPRLANVTSDVAACCQGGPLADTSLLINPQSRGVRNVVVWLRPDTDDRRDPFPPNRIHPTLKNPPPMVYTIDQPKCQFEPRIVAARAGDSLVFKNSASIPHNVNFVTDDHDLNQTIPSGGDYRVTRPLVAQAVPILIKCDIHPWMAGRVRVFDHPYFALTGADGRFELKAVPSGTWRIVYWHEDGFHDGRAGATGARIVVAGDATLPPLKLALPAVGK